MPCPPSYEEQQASSGAHWAGRARAHSKNVKAAQQLLSDLHRSGGCDEARVAAALQIDPGVGFGPEPDWWGDPSQSDALVQWVAATKASAKELEITLCKVLTVLVCLWDELSGEHKTKTRTELYLKLEEIHRSHREQDRGQVLFNLKKQMDCFHPKTPEHRQWKQKYQYVRGLSIEELMRDRDTLSAFS